MAMIELLLISLVTTVLLITWLGATLKIVAKSVPPGVTVNQLVMLLGLTTVQFTKVSEWKLFRSSPGKVSRSVKFVTDQPAGSAPSATLSNISRYSGGPKSTFT